MKELMPDAVIFLTEVVLGSKLGLGLQTGCDCYWNHGATEKWTGTSSWKTWGFLSQFYLNQPKCWWPHHKLLLHWSSGHDGKIHWSAQVCWQDIHEIWEALIKAENQAGMKASCFRKCSSWTCTVSNCCIYLLFYSILTSRFQACIELRIPYTMRFATVCNILHKRQKLNIWHILHIVRIFIWIFILSTAPLQRKQKTGILWLGCPYTIQTKANCLLSAMNVNKDKKTVSWLLETFARAFDSKHREH